MLASASTSPSSPALIPLHIAEPDARVQHVPEAVLQALWAHLRFRTDGLSTTDGHAVEVLTPGLLNSDAGPDFRDARVRVTGPDGVLTWSGDVEVHRTSGEWLLHRHHEDPRYDRVVLHVVLVADRHTGTLRRADGTPLPELVLEGRLDESLRHLLYQFFAHPAAGFPCAPSWPAVPDDVKVPWLRRLGLDRLRVHTDALADAYARTPDLAALLHSAVFRALGYAKNAEPMVTLAKRLPLVALRRLDDPGDVEAALFGVAGLLPDEATLAGADADARAHVAALRGRFERLCRRMPLSPMRAVEWQFFRLRPANFPTRRIAQAAALLAPPGPTGDAGLLRFDPLGRLRAALDDPRPLAALRHLFLSAEPDPFWQERVRFERRSAFASAGIGQERADRIIANAVLPVLLLDAEQRGDERQREAVVGVLEALPGAEDEVTRRFTDGGGHPDSALLAHGLQQLYRHWCTAGRCLDCAVGQAILRRG